MKNMLMARPPKGPGLTLTEEEQKQPEYKLDLLEAQLQFDCQLEHGNSLVCAGRPANLLKVGFGGYEYPGGVIRGGSLPPNRRCCDHLRGLTAVAPSCRGGGRFPISET